MKSKNPSSRTWSWAWQLRATQAFETIAPALLSHRRSIPCPGLQMMVGLCMLPGWDAHSLPLSRYFSSCSARICLPKSAPISLGPAFWDPQRHPPSTALHSLTKHIMTRSLPGLEGLKREDSQFLQLLPRRLKDSSYCL